MVLRIRDSVGKEWVGQGVSELVGYGVSEAGPGLGGVEDRQEGGWGRGMVAFYFMEGGY